LELSIMPIISDYHIHTPLCKHADGEPFEYLKCAHRKGLQSIGFSDHSPVPSNFDTISRMDLSEFPTYQKMIEKIKQNEYGINVLFGIESDFVTDREKEIAEFIKNNNFDYIIGSVHHVGDIPFDNPDYLNRWNRPDMISKIWNAYSESLLEMISRYDMDIIGHIDLPKKFNLFPDLMEPFYSNIREILRVAAKRDIVMEISTGGLRKPVSEIYPGKDILKLAHDLKVKITFSSDAHSPNEIAYSFAEAGEYAVSAGYTEYVVFKGNREKTLQSIR